MNMKFSGLSLATTAEDFWGYFFVVIGSVSFIGFVFAAIVLKLFHVSANPLIQAIENDRHSERNSSITFQHQVIIWWAGLMRGAVSVALAFKQFTYSGVTLDPVNAAMVTNTIIVVLFTTLVFGFLTKPLVSYLLPNDTNPNTGNRGGKRTEPGSPTEDSTLPLLSFDESASTNFNRAKDSLSLLMEQPVYTIHRYWRKFDDTYMRPIFGGPRPENQSQC